MTTTQPEPDVIDLLSADHREALSLIEEIRVTSDQDRQRDLADVLIAEIVRHAVAEETIVYPVVKRHLSEGEEHVQHDLTEHQEIEEALQALESSDPAQGSFITDVERLQALLEHHVQDEESEQFPELRERIPADELRTMATQVEALKKVAPTRPHPSAPDAPLFHLAAGPGVGLVDRLRDKLSGRTTDPSDL